MKKVALIGFILLPLVVIAALATGSVSLPIADVFSALLGEGDQRSISIVRDLRAPRVALAGLAGAALSVSGASLQGTLRNPLAEPYLLGVSGGAAVGAVIALALGFTGPEFLTVSAFIGAALATFIVAIVARHAGGSLEPRHLLMAGVVTGAFANAAIMIVLADAPPERIRGALWWMMGSTSDATWESVQRTGVALLFFGTFLVVKARELDILSLGDESAAALGANVERSVLLIFLLASWLAAATVAAVGLIGFVGLMVPNIARALGAVRHRPMIVVSAIYGAILLIVSDIAARSLRSPVELPLGAITAIVGVPFFLIRMRRVL